MDDDGRIELPCSCGCGEKIVLRREPSGYVNRWSENRAYIEVNGVIVPENVLTDAIQRLKDLQQ